MTETKEPYGEPKAQSLSREMKADARGWLFEGVRESELGHIAQAYVTSCYPGVVKGWHQHRRQTDRMVCVSGMARVVTARLSGEHTVYFGRNPRMEPVYEFKEDVIGPLCDKKVVIIPPGLWHAFTPCGNESCMIVNCPDREYDGSDEFRIPLADIPYDWEGVSR